MSVTRCRRCDQPMETGFLLDETGERVDRCYWAEGEMGTYMRGGKTHLPITALRCLTCGILELYANELGPQSHSR